MEHLARFVKKLPSHLRDDFSAFIDLWEQERMHYIFLHRLTDGSLAGGACVPLHELESVRVVNSADVNDVVRVVADDPEFADLAAETRYGSVRNVAGLTRPQLRNILFRMSKRRELLFLDAGFSVVNDVVEAAL